jgi:hypothetical protein
MLVMMNPSLRNGTFTGRGNGGIVIVSAGVGGTLTLVPPEEDKAPLIAGHKAVIMPLKSRMAIRINQPFQDSLLLKGFFSVFHAVFWEHILAQCPLSTRTIKF